MAHVHWNVMITESELALLIELVKKDLQRPVISETDSKGRYEGVLAKLKNLQDGPREGRHAETFTRDEFGMFYHYALSATIDNGSLSTQVITGYTETKADGTIDLRLIP